jgi:hypothetical protein
MSAPTGTSAKNRVDVQSAAGTTYQWFFNSVPIAGATNETLTILNVMGLDGGGNGDPEQGSSDVVRPAAGDAEEKILSGGEGGKLTRDR